MKNTLMNMFYAEKAASDWWSDMSDAERKAYIAAHPGSKYDPQDVEVNPDE